MSLYNHAFSIGVEIVTHHEDDTHISFKDLIYALEQRVAQIKADKEREAFDWFGMHEEEDEPQEIICNRCGDHTDETTSPDREVCPDCYAQQELEAMRDFEA